MRDKTPIRAFSMLAVASARWPVRLLVVLTAVAGLLSGCGRASYVLNAVAPVSPDMVITYATERDVTGLRARDGEIGWHAATGNVSLHWAPVVSGGVLYTEGGTRQPPNATIVAVRLTDGQVLWHTPMPEVDLSLAVGDAMVLVAAGQHGLYALDPASGAVRWHQAVNVSGPIQISNRIVIATHNDSQETAYLAAFRERDGTPLWHVSTNYPIGAGANQIAVHAVDGFGDVSALALSTGRLLWESDIKGNVLAVNDRLVLVRGVQQMAALDARTGQVVWQSRAGFDGNAGPYPPYPGAVWSAPDATSVYGTHQDEVIALRTRDGGEIWHTAFPDYTPIQLTLEDGVLFALLAPPPESSTQARLVSLDAKSGAIYWQRDLPDVMWLAQTAPPA